MRRFCFTLLGAALVLAAQPAQPQPQKKDAKGRDLKYEGAGDSAPEPKIGRAHV